MTTITFSGKNWMGAGLVLAEPCTRTVSDALATFLIENHPDEFALAEGDAAPVQEVAADGSQPSDEVESAGTETAPAEAVVEPDQTPVTDPAQEPVSDSGAIEQVEAPEATQEASTQTEQTKPLSKMNRAELTAVATQLGLEVAAEQTNKGIIQAIRVQQDASVSE